jgi:chromosome segregation ATPase
MTQEEKIKDLEERIAMMDADNSALCADLAHYKKVAAGLKGRNKQLSERLQHYKELDLEGDGLYEKKIAECAEKDKVIEGLHCQMNNIAIKNKELETTVSAKQELIDEMELTIQELRKPWWKKIFS